MLNQIANTLGFNIGLLVISFIILFKSADFFVESAAGIALHFNIPKLLVGIIIVGFGTTAPEIAVSAISSFQGQPEFAFGNALGSVIVDDGVALALAALIAPVAIAANKTILKVAGLFLVFIDILAYILTLNGIIGRVEGFIFILLLAGYLIFVIINQKKGKFSMDMGDDEILEKAEKEKSKLGKIILLFIIGLAGVLIAAELVVRSSKFIAESLSIPKAIVGLTVIAIGTSLPEISTCIVAARKGHGEIAIGDIIGADILNILWILGVSAAINPIHIDSFTLHFSFLSMIIIVFTMLGTIFLNKFKLSKWQGIVLIVLYAVYAFLNYNFYY